MVDSVDLMGAILLLALLGLPLACARGVRDLSLSARFSIAFMVGTVAFVVYVLGLSMSGIPWSDPFAIVPILIIAVGASWWIARRDGPRRAVSTNRWQLLAAIAGGLGVLHLVTSVLGSRATSTDYFYFWGVKAARFAEVRGIDVEYLTSSLTVHAHQSYPPLVPLVLGWGGYLADGLPWRGALLSTALWVLLAYPVVLTVLRTRLPGYDAALAGGVWVTAISLAISDSLSAGNAEGPLVFFTSIAVAALLDDGRSLPSWIAPVACCGVVLTKSEGLVIWILVAAGFAMRDWASGHGGVQLARRATALVLLPACAISSWKLFSLIRGIPLSDPVREKAGDVDLGRLVPTLVEMVRNLDAGSGWLAWCIAVVITCLSWRRWRIIAPALAVAVGLPCFLIVYYLHVPREALPLMVEWTAGRVSLSALSAALIAAAVASGGMSGNEEEVDQNADVSPPPV